MFVKCTKPSHVTFHTKSSERKTVRDSFRNVNVCFPFLASYYEIFWQKKTVYEKMSPCRAQGIIS